MPIEKKYHKNCIKFEQFLSCKLTKTYNVDKWVTIEYFKVITNNGKPIALLTPLSDENLEETVKAVRKARAINSVRAMQEISMKSGSSELSNDEIENEITEYRNKIK